MESGARDEEEGGAPDEDGSGGSGGAGGGGLRGQADPSSERQVIRWERFLPSRSLRVLLVEHDDPTRHIVAALLRKCSYHVVAVADGLKAWEVLKEKHYGFDLVLAEVAMPSLSGIGLLSKIMSTEECKNIPVIMLKCMLKGAVDFLVKPIRKNELRNLWQHVWRRHCSNSHTNASNNNAASNHISTIAGDGSKTGENSDQGSDAQWHHVTFEQGSDSKPEMGIESDQKHRGPHLAEGGSTSREVEAKPEELDNGAPIMANALKLDDDVEAGDISAGTALVEKYKEKNSSFHKSAYREEGKHFMGSKDGDLPDPNSYCQNNAPDETLNDMIDFIESVANRKCSSCVSEKHALRKDALPETSTSSHAKSTSEFGSSPHLELSLRRQQLNGCVDQDFKQKHILNHSNASAFSRLITWHLISSLHACTCMSNSHTNASNNNAASNHISTIAGDGSKTGENSDQGSDAQWHHVTFEQGSDSKPEMGIESDQKHRGPHLAEGGSTSREVEAKPEELDNGAPIMANALKLDDDVEAGDISAGTALVEKYKEKNSSFHKSAYREEGKHFMGSKDGDLPDPNSYCQNNAPDETLNDMIDFIESVANRKCSSCVSEKHALRKDALPETSTSSHAKSTSEFGSSPHLELSLRRQQLNGCVDQDFKQKHILNHSNASAFSRYGDKKAHHSCKKPVSSAVCVRTIECIDKSQLHVSTHGSDNDKNISLLPKGMVFHQGNAGETTKYFQVTSESNREDAGLVSCPAGEDDHAGHSSKGENMVFSHPQFGFIPLPTPVGAIPYQSLCAGYGAILQPVFYPEASLQPHSSAAAEKATVQITSDQSGHHDDHRINHPQCNEFRRHEENRLPHYRRQHLDMEPGDSRDLSCTPVELANQGTSCSQDILKGSGSNYSGETADADAFTGTALESGPESGAQNCSRKVLDSDRSCCEAALIKFRMKRKDRCFEKKVRYHSRKKLAEQRPRVKGQFVRRKAPDSMTTTEAEN
ncbi:hypothetical protein COCNU_scaffold014359G000010 [Cocos nucifera]|nr:hypothetical protein [Cocos nucifera]